MAVMKLRNTIHPLHNEKDTSFSHSSATNLMTVTLENESTFGL